MRTIIINGKEYEVDDRGIIKPPKHILDKYDKEFKEKVLQEKGGVK